VGNPIINHLPFGDGFYHPKKESDLGDGLVLGLTNYYIYLSIYIYMHIWRVLKIGNP